MIMPKLKAFDFVFCYGFYSHGVIKNMIDRICWNITSKCNDNCSFCFRDNISEELSIEENLYIANKLCEYGIKHIAFSGGEALLYHGIFDLIEFFNKHGVDITLISNCILLDEEVLDRVLKFINWLAIPIDSISNNSVFMRNHNHLVNIQKVLSYINSTNKYDTLVKVNTVVTSINYQEIPIIYSNYIYLYPFIMRWNLFEFTPLRGKAVENNERFAMNTDMDTYIINYLNKLNISNSHLCIKYKHKSTIEDSYFVISPNGKVMKSDGIHEIYIGNLLQESVISIESKLCINTELYDKRTQFSQIVII